MLETSLLSICIKVLIYFMLFTCLSLYDGTTRSKRFFHCFDSPGNHTLLVFLTLDYLETRRDLAREVFLGFTRLLILSL